MDDESGESTWQGDVSGREQSETERDWDEVDEVKKEAGSRDKVRRIISASSC